MGADQKWADILELQKENQTAIDRGLNQTGATAIEAKAKYWLAVRNARSANPTTNQQVDDVETAINVLKNL